MSERKFKPVSQFEKNDPTLSNEHKWAVSEAVNIKKGVRTVTTATSGDMHGAINGEHLHAYERAKGFVELKGGFLSPLAFAMLVRTALRDSKGEAIMLGTPEAQPSGMTPALDANGNVLTARDSNEVIFRGDIDEINYSTMKVLRHHDMTRVPYVSLPYDGE